MKNSEKTLDMIVNLCKNRGFSLVLYTFEKQT